MKKDTASTIGENIFVLILVIFFLIGVSTALSKVTKFFMFWHNNYSDAHAICLLDYRLSVLEHSEDGYHVFNNCEWNNL